MKKARWIAMSVVGIICMVAVLLVSVIIGGCDTMIECVSGNVPMRCHWTFIAEAYAAGAGIVASVCALMAKSKEGRQVAAIMFAVAAAICILLLTPVGIGLCAHDTSACHPPAYACAALSAVAIIASIVMLVKADPEAADKPKMTL